MTFGELLTALAARSKFPVLDGDVAQTLAKSRAGAHREPIMGEIVAAIADGCGCADVAAPLERAAAVKSLSKVRLKYMADDAPVHGFRMVEGLIVNIDEAYNDEALRNR